MTEAEQLLEDGLLLRESEQGNPTFVYRGTHWPCHAGALRRGMELGIGPAVNQLTRLLVVRKTAIPVRTVDAAAGWTVDADDEPLASEDAMPPHPGKLMSYQQRDYEVEFVEETDVAWMVHLKSPD